MFVYLFLFIDLYQSTAHHKRSYLQKDIVIIIIIHIDLALLLICVR